MKTEYLIVTFIILTAITYIICQVLYLFKSKKRVPQCSTCVAISVSNRRIKVKSLLPPKIHIPKE